MKIYSESEAVSESMKYFDGDELAATTFVNKYALRSETGELLEKSPKQMHDRIISEILRIENGYPNPMLTEDILKEYIYKFKYVIPGGSAMSGIGNKFKYTSLSNCFAVASPVDSYGGIFYTDQIIAQLCKRRGGTGTDLSNLRPSGAEVTNDAKTSSGMVSFMDRYSNTVREVGQNGRRGALMLTLSVNHPDAESFIDAKLQQGKVTGANISIKLTDEFMKAVKDKQYFAQVFPITENIWDLVDFRDDPSNCFELNGKSLEIGKLYKGKKPGTYVRIINAHKFWMKLMNNAWKSAEPGILFIDNIKNESPADFYPEFETITTNPCGEIPLCEFDSCRLIALNLYSFVDYPFTCNAKFNYEKLKTISYNTQRIMDDIIDLEIECIQRIINKIEKDPESEDIKSIELNTWKKILHKTKAGRRTGVGITAEGDMLAALGIPYGSDDAIKFCEDVHKIIATSCYESSIDLAKDRGTFLAYKKSELDFNSKSPRFITRVYNNLSEDYQLKWKSSGRRNIACLTIAPTGTVSLMTQTTSGIEPLFKAWYIRRRKTSDKSKAVFTDNVGDMFEEFKVFHPKFVIWYKHVYMTAEVSVNMTIPEVISRLNDLDEESLQKIYEKSPWYKSTAQDIDWIQKVKLQGAVQKWVDHSISCTTNLPKGTTVETVAKVYETAYLSGCKGHTVYVDGSRDGVLISSPTKSNDSTIVLKQRPDKLPAKIVRFKNGSENWIAFVGMMNNNPYELFCGKVDDDLRILPKSIIEGEIVRIDVGPAVNGKVPHRYDFQYKVPYGYTNTMPAINNVFDSAYWNYARLISGMLRLQIPVDQVINVLEGLNSDMGDNINTWKRGVIRAFKQFVKDGTISVDKCPECRSNLIYQGGCKKCPSCGWSKCD